MPTFQIPHVILTEVSPPSDNIPNAITPPDGLYFNQAAEDAGYEVAVLLHDESFADRLGFWERIAQTVMGLFR